MYSVVIGNFKKGRKLQNFVVAVWRVLCRFGVSTLVVSWCVLTRLMKNEFVRMG
jgi:hypothetical protein